MFATYLFVAFETGMLIGTDIGTLLLVGNIIVCRENKIELTII